MKRLPALPPVPDQDEGYSPFAGAEVYESFFPPILPVTASWELAEDSETDLRRTGMSLDRPLPSDCDPGAPSKARFSLWQYVEPLPVSHV